MLKNYAYSYIRVNRLAAVVLLRTHLQCHRLFSLWHVLCYTPMPRYTNEKVLRYAGRVGCAYHAVAATEG
jgi:hypothetical protein